MSPENAHKLIRIYMGGLILGVNTFYTLSCFLKRFALVDKGLTKLISEGWTKTTLEWRNNIWYIASITRYKNKPIRGL